MHAWSEVPRPDSMTTSGSVAANRCPIPSIDGPSSCARRSSTETVSRTSWIISCCSTDPSLSRQECTQPVDGSIPQLFTLAFGDECRERLVATLVICCCIEDISYIVSAVPGDQHNMVWKCCSNVIPQAGKQLPGNPCHKYVTKSNQRQARVDSRKGISRSISFCSFFRLHQIGVL